MRNILHYLCAGALMAGLWTLPAQGQPLKTRYMTATLDTFETAQLIQYPVFDNSRGFFRWVLTVDTSQVGGEAPKIRLRYATGIPTGNTTAYGFGADDTLIICADLDSAVAFTNVEDSLPAQYIGKLIGYQIFPRPAEAIWLEITRMDTASSGSTGTVTITQGLIAQ